MIGIVAGLAGYATSSPAPAVIPELSERPDSISGTQGEIVTLNSGRLSIVTDSGERLDFALPADAEVEQLRSIALSDLAIGDWLNGGAIPHPDTVLALLSLILLDEPITP